MDWITIATAVGAGLGAVGGTYAAVTHRLVSKRVDDVETVSIQQKDLDEFKCQLEDISREAEKARSRLTQIETKIEAHREDDRKVEDRVLRLEQSQRAFVTDEEFSAHVSETTKSVNQLTEKMGRAIGVLESWGRGR